MASLPSGYKGGGGIFMQPEFPELRQIQQAFRGFPKKLSAKYIGAALRRTIKPAEAALKANVKKLSRVTGNLQRAVATKVKRYPKTGNAVALVGFIAAGSGKSASARGGSVRKGKDRAFHAGFIEFGTRPRRTRGMIASSYNRLGKFTIKPIAKRGKFAGVARVQTTPKYPKAFFKKGDRSGVNVGYTPIGGKSGQPPIRTAYERTLPQMRQLLPGEMAKGLENALKELANPFPPRQQRAA